MTENKNELALSTFYPAESLKITEIKQQPEQILIKMKSITHSCICPGCNQGTNKYHGTYIRKVQDLPILGKRVMLDIKAYEYQCENLECSPTSFAENFDGFLRSILFIGPTYYCDEITDLVLNIGGTPYFGILSSEIPPLNFSDLNSVLLTILGVCANKSAALISLILILIFAWNYIKILFCQTFAICKQVISPTSISPPHF